jgi:predicted RNA-binding protein with PIN domain
MILIIDGYNVLKYRHEKSHLNQDEREQFIALLKRYAALKKIEVSVIFDGGPLGWPDRETHGLVRVIYTGKKETADEYIINYCERHKGGDIVVVSSDREIKKVAGKMGIEAISAAEFYRFLKDAAAKSYEKRDIHRKSVKKKEYSTSEPEIDSLMEYGSTLRVPKKDDSQYKKSNGPSKGLSKKEKQRMQKLKKL